MTSQRAYETKSGPDPENGREPWKALKERSPGKGSRRNGQRGRKKSQRQLSDSNERMNF